MISFPNCKINLGLHILQKRTDGFHDLETVFYPVSLWDGLEIIQKASPSSKPVEFSASGVPVDVQAENNICYKAYHLLKKDFPGLPQVQMHLHKVVPSGAGLGGGSADGAFTLVLLNKKFALGLNEEQLIQYSLQLGSDCPFFIINKPCIASGRGEQMETINLDLSIYRIVLVNPKIHINTGWAFSHITPSAGRSSLKDFISLPITEWKHHLANDFENPVFHHHPEIKDIKQQMYEKGAIYASMSGSGSTVYGIFPKDEQLQFQFPSQYFVKSI